jgi:hypothetical protein
LRIAIDLHSYVDDRRRRASTRRLVSLILPDHRDQHPGGCNAVPSGFVFIHYLPAVTCDCGDLLRIDNPTEPVHNCRPLFFVDWPSLTNSTGH